MQAALQKITVGNVEITPLIDAPILMDPRHFIPQHAEQFMAEYSAQADERGLFQMSVTCFLVRSTGKTLLVDSGLGNRRRPNFPVGKLDQSLRDAGVVPSDVDAVLNTHLHIDHVGWNTVDHEDGTREIFFPRARFVIQRPEWDYWMTPERLAEPGNAHLVECVEPLTHSGRIDFLEGETAFDEHLTFVPTPGHTPGHVAIGIYSEGERAIIIGDASHHPVQLDHPDWSPAFDVDPVQSASTRDRLFEDAAADGRTFIAGHWQYPGMGRIVRLNGKRVFKAL
jgi:glyoxylase-like metal-dependent hydrolase (beta-lactamase superfamily II)